MPACETITLLFKLFSIALASLMHDSEGFLGQVSQVIHPPCSHLCTLAGKARDSTLQLSLKACISPPKPYPCLSSSPSPWQNRDTREVPLACSKSLGKRHQLWDLLKPSLGLSFTGHNLQCAPSPQLMLASTGGTNTWGWAFRP